jgi:hypothetical protein
MNVLAYYIVSVTQCSNLEHWSAALCAAWLLGKVMRLSQLTLVFATFRTHLPLSMCKQHLQTIYLSLALKINPDGSVS